MLDQLKTYRRVVGIKQLRRALKEGSVLRAFAARNADPALTDPLLELCNDCGVEICWVPTMSDLGKACGISVGAAAAGILKSPE